MSKHGEVFRGITLKVVELFHIFEPSKIELGNGILLPLTMADGKQRSLPPSFDNLCVHFGLFQPVTEFRRNIQAGGFGLQDWQEYAMLCYQKYKIFAQQHILPVRRELEGKAYRDKLWFYCLPRGDVFTKDEATGELKYSWDPHSFVLCLLPMTVRDAIDRYKREKAELLILASQVAWLTVSFCQRRRITTRREAEAMLGDWRYNLQSNELCALTEQKITGALH